MCRGEDPERIYSESRETLYVKYYLVDGEAIDLCGARAKILGMNVWDGTT